MYPTMIKKGLAAAAALMMLLTVAGCSDQDTSSSTADTASSVTTAETASTEVTTTVDIEALMPQEEELDPTLIPFQDIAFQVPAGWGNLNVENLVVWYPNDGSGSLTVQCFPEDELEITGTDEKDLLKNLGQNLAKGQTVFSEVWNELLGTDAYAITYSPETDASVDTAQKVNLSVLFYVNDLPYDMTFANYTGTSPVLKNSGAILNTVQLRDASDSTDTTDATDTATDETDTETETEATTSESKN